MAKRRRTTVSVEAVPVLFPPKYGGEVYRERGGSSGTTKTLSLSCAKQLQSLSRPRPIFACVYYLEACAATYNVSRAYLGWRGVSAS